MGKRSVRIPVTGGGKRRKGAHRFCRGSVDRRRARGVTDGGVAQCVSPGARLRTAVYEKQNLR